MITHQRSRLRFGWLASVRDRVVRCVGIASMASMASIAALLVAVAFPVAAADGDAAPGTLRERFPAGSIDSLERADAALGETAGAKARVEKAFAAEARACLSRVLVNACVDAARDAQKKRLADIDAVELEATRWKRRDRADRLDADRAKRDSERAANAPADAAQRARNREAFDARQVQADREVKAAKSRAERVEHGTGAKHGPAIRVPPAATTEAALAQRAKNATGHATKVAEAEAHRKDIERRVARKQADRKRRDDEKAAKDAKAAAAAAATPAR